MGTNNRQRRAAKARRRAKAKQRTASRSGFGRGDPPSDASRDAADARRVGPIGHGELLNAAVEAERIDQDAVRDRLITQLAARSPLSVGSTLQHLLTSLVSRSWRRGWQPADLARVVSSRYGRLECELLRCAIASDAARYEELGRRIAPEWMAQLDRLPSRRWWDSARPWPLQLNGDWHAVLLGGVRLLDVLMHLVPLPVLSPPPDDWGGLSTTGPVESELPSDVLHKVRSLLAKAESTTFEAEVEALTAKAQELMTRYRIDRAALGEADESHREAAVGRRIAVDDPYADAKAMLLAQIGGANGCRAVWCKELGFSTVFGFAGELAMVDELFTSLLVQASAALQREGSKRDRAGRSRTTRFRRSFLVSFSLRIGQRLRDTAAATVSAAESQTGTALVPVLAAREAAAAEAADAAFPGTTRFAPSATDDEGWFAGRLSADAADLGVGAPLERRTA